MATTGVEDDFSRRVFCILGAPIDDITMTGLVGRIHQAAASRTRLFLSTPNLNFLILCQRDPDFRASLIASDLCPADGVGVLLICRLLGVPIAARVAGSDLPAALQASQGPAGDGPLRIAFLGGESGVGERAREVVNTGNTSRLVCVGAFDPGLMTAERMEDPSIVKSINAKVADFLLVALGAQKGQAWLMRHGQALNVPVISHLGATLNFLAGRVKRAPTAFRKLGLEWLWRIGQEPHLAKRYLRDGAQLLWLGLTRIVPLGLWLRWNGGARAMGALSVWLDADQAEHSRTHHCGRGPGRPASASDGGVSQCCPGRPWCRSRPARPAIFWNGVCWTNPHVGKGNSLAGTGSHNCRGITFHRARPEVVRSETSDWNDGSLVENEISSTRSDFGSAATASGGGRSNLRLILRIGGSVVMWPPL